MSLRDDPEEARRRLRERHAEVERLLAAGETDAAPVELDQQRQGRLSRVGALQQQAMAQDAIRRRRSELARIEAAIARIGDGEFGYCSSCGEAIGLRRLELDPATALCIACAGGS